MSILQILGRWGIWLMFLFPRTYGHNLPQHADRTYCYRVEPDVLFPPLVAF